VPVSGRVRSSEDRRAHRRDESGFTLIEMVIVVSVLLLVMGPLLAALDSVTRTENRNQALVSNQEAVRVVLVAITRDLRGSKSLTALADPTTYPLEVDMVLINGTQVRWRLDTTTNTLYRETSPAGSPPTWTRSTTLAMVLNTTQTPAVGIFRYLRDASDTEFDPSTALSADIANCTIHIHVLLVSQSNPGPLPFTSESDVELRNRLPGGIFGC